MVVIALLVMMASPQPMPAWDDVVRIEVAETACSAWRDDDDDQNIMTCPGRQPPPSVCVLGDAHAHRAYDAMASAVPGKGGAAYGGHVAHFLLDLRDGRQWAIDIPMWPADGDIWISANGTPMLLSEPAWEQLRDLARAKWCPVR